MLGNPNRLATHRGNTRYKTKTMNKQFLTIAAASVFGALVFSFSAILTETKIDTKKVKGTIQTEGNAEVKSGMLASSDYKYDGVWVKLNDKSGIGIYPTPKTFEEVKADMEGAMKNWGTKYQALETKDNVFFYEMIDKSHKPGDSFYKGGFNFVILIKGKTKNYFLNGQGGNVMQALQDKALAQKVMKIALTFKPLE